MLLRSRHTIPLAWVDLFLITVAYSLGYYLRFKEWQNLVNMDFLAFGGCYGCYGYPARWWLGFIPSPLLRILSADCGFGFAVSRFLR